MDSKVKKEEENWIDLTKDECLTPISEYKQEEGLATPATKLKPQLKQKDLNFFFAASKRIPKSKQNSKLDLHSPPKLKKIYPEDTHLSYECKPFEEKVKLNENIEVIDLCADLSLELKDEKLKDLKYDKKQTKRSKRTRIKEQGKDLEFKEEETNSQTKSLKSKKREGDEAISQSQSSNCVEDNKTEIKKQSWIRNVRPGTIESEKNQCPPYKVIEGTTFAVDAFNYGRLKDVTVYFLTHFHTDHYVGLTKKFSMPIYASGITINLIREFVGLDENLLNILPLNKRLRIEDTWVTAVDANHCPGAVMILFELPCGKRILHTGDFRWSPKMELDSILQQQQNIDLMYLDTTHIRDRHVISSQEKCISKAIDCVRQFIEKNENKRILFVVCTDVIGKEIFWLSIAQAFNLKIWADGKRRRALSAIGNAEILEKLVADAREADLHVVSHSEAGYKHLEDYFRKFIDSHDMVLSIKPKGSESLTPEFGDQVNSIAVRYSEHSTQKELRRCLGFLLPKRVISTVPLGKNVFRCPKVPVSWHTKELYVPYKKQSSLLNFVSLKNN